jgi:hypothetical protein
MAKQKRKKADSNPNALSPARLEFANLWISYKILHDRLAARVELDHVDFDGKMFYIFFVFWILFMSSYDFATGWRAVSHIAVYETLAKPTFAASDLATKQVGTNGSIIHVEPHLINFHGIKTIEDYNTWLEDVLLENIYVDPVYNPVTGREDSPQLHNQQSLLWGVAVRQHRVHNKNLDEANGCCVPKELRDALTCHPTYGNEGVTGVVNAPNVMETEGFGQWVYDQECVANNGTESQCLVHQWTYATEASLGDQVLTANYLSTGIQSSYGGGGYRVILPRNTSRAKQFIAEMLGQKRCILLNQPCLGEPTKFVDERTRAIIVTVQTYTVSTNIALKANLIVEFGSTGKTATKIHFHTDATLLDGMLPQPAEIWHRICEFIMVIIAIFLFMRCLTVLWNHTQEKKFDLFEWLNAICFLCVVIFFLVSAFDRITGVNAKILRERMRTANETGYYPISFAPVRIREEVLLVASLVLVLQVFRYMQFFSSLSLLDGACNKLTWALLLVVSIVFAILLLFTIAGMLMFSEVDYNFSSFQLAFIALCRTYFGTFDFDEAYSTSNISTFVFVTTYYWIAIITMTVLSSAILIDGVRMQSEFEQLQRRGLPPPIGIDFQRIFKRWMNNFLRCFFYRYGCWKSPLCQDFMHSWFSLRKWYQWGKGVRWCAWCRRAAQGKDMSYPEALERLVAWKLETENANVLYMQFNDLMIAMRGDNRHRRIVDDHEVGTVLTLCYIDPVLKGESYFRDNKEKEMYEAAEREGTEVFVEKETEYIRSLRSLKMIFSGVHTMTLQNQRQREKYKRKMDDISQLMKANERKLESLRGRFDGLKGVQTKPM